MYDALIIVTNCNYESYVTPHKERQCSQYTSLAAVCIVMNGGPGQEFYLFFKGPRPVLWPSQPPEVGKWYGNEAEHLPPSSDKIKESLDLYLYLPVCLHDTCLIKQLDNFMLYFIKTIYLIKNHVWLWCPSLKHSWLYHFFM
jgi:hypothetical protein